MRGDPIQLADKPAEILVPVRRRRNGAEIRTALNNSGQRCWRLNVRNFDLRQCGNGESLRLSLAAKRHEQRDGDGSEAQCCHASELTLSAPMNRDAEHIAPLRPPPYFSSGLIFPSAKKTTSVDLPFSTYSAS